MEDKKAILEGVIVNRNEKGEVENVVIYNQKAHRPEMFNVSPFGMDDYLDLLNK